MAFDSPTKKIKLDEPSDINPTSSDKATSDYTTSDCSPTTFEDTKDMENQNDLYFVLHHVSILKNAIEALSDTEFNPGQQAVIQAGKNGCEITVYNSNDSQTDGEVFGVLRLNTACLVGYECRNPLRKMFSLNGVARFLRDIVSLNKKYVVMFIENGSNRLSFQWSSSIAGFGLGRPFNIELYNVNYEQDWFPYVTYGLEAVIPLNSFINTIADVMLLEGYPPTKDAFENIKPESVSTKLTDDQVLSEVKSEVDKIWLNWVHWNSLERASEMANECLVYLVTNPPQRIMVRLKLGELGETVYLNQVNFLSDTVKELPYLGHFHSLL